MVKYIKDNDDNDDKQKVLKQQTEEQLELESKKNKIENIWMKVEIDGPYGTSGVSCTSRMFESEHAVIIAGGNREVIPFASVLQSLWLRYKEIKHDCINCSNHFWSDSIISRKKLKKVDFIWINRDYQRFEWFIELLSKIELEQLKLEDEKKERFIRIHLYITGETKDKEFKYIDLLAKGRQEVPADNTINDAQLRNSCSLIMISNRPKFNELFHKISNDNPRKVDVYFSGSPQLEEVVNVEASAQKLKFYKEYF
jgi:NADPH oxidase 5